MINLGRDKSCGEKEIRVKGTRVEEMEKEVF